MNQRNLPRDVTLRAAHALRCFAFLEEEVTTMPPKKRVKLIEGQGKLCFGKPKTGKSYNLITVISIDLITVISIEL